MDINIHHTAFAQFHGRLEAEECIRNLGHNGFDIRPLTGFEVPTAPFSPALVQKLEDLIAKFDTEKSPLNSSLEELLYKQPNQ